MRRRLLYTLLLCILVTGCSNKYDSVTQLNELSTVQSQLAINDLRIVNSQTSIRRGGIGFITVQGNPRVRYTINTSYRLNGRVINVNQWRMSGENGQVTFNWIVDPQTTPGTYSATISGGGKTLRTDHTVLP